MKVAMFSRQREGIKPRLTAIFLAGVCLGSGTVNSQTDNNGNTPGATASRFGESMTFTLSEFSSGLADKISELRRIKICGVGVSLAMCGPAKGGAAGASSEENALLEDSRLSLIAVDDYSNSKRDETLPGEGYEESSNAFSIGVDYRISPDFFTGVTVSALSNETELDRQQGSQDGDSFFIGAHLSKYWGIAYVDARVAYGSSSLDTKRRDNLGSYKGSTDASSWSIDFAAGYGFSKKRWRVNPNAGLSMTMGSIDAYRERSAGATGIVRDLEDQDIESIVLTLGIQADYAIPTDWGVLVPSARMNALSELADAIEVKGVQRNASDQSQAGVIDEESTEPDRAALELAVGLSGQFKHGWSAYADSKVLLGHDYLDRYSLVVGARYEFQQ